MKKDASLIPLGMYCYDYTEGGERVQCPYWNRTDYGTVRCEYLEKEVIDEFDDDAEEKIRTRFGVADASDKFGWCDLLADECRICR